MSKGGARIGQVFMFCVNTRFWLGYHCESLFVVVFIINVVIRSHLTLRSLVASSSCFLLASDVGLIDACSGNQQREEIVVTTCRCFVPLVVFKGRYRLQYKGVSFLLPEKRCTRVNS